MAPANTGSLCGRAENTSMTIVSAGNIDRHTLNAIEHIIHDPDPVQKTADVL